MRNGSCKGQKIDRIRIKKTNRHEQGVKKPAKKTSKVQVKD